jgi:hypothetical protein
MPLLWIYHILLQFNRIAATIAISIVQNLAYNQTETSLLLEKYPVTLPKYPYEVLLIMEVLY